MLIRRKTREILATFQKSYETADGVFARAQASKQAAALHQAHFVSHFVGGFIAVPPHCGAIEAENGRRRAMRARARTKWETKWRTKWA